MNAHPPPRRPGLFGRPVLTVTLVLATLAGAGLGGMALAERRPEASAPAPHWETAPSGAPSSRPPSPQPESGAADDSFTFSATGDIMMSNAPNKLPPNGGKGFFDSVRDALKSDLVMGNLEQPLTEDTGTSKCGAGSDNCYAFRSPPSYARHLKAAGFQLMNTANNHSKDFGVQGARNTVKALESAGLKHTGAADQITVVETKGIRVAVVGFSSYAGANPLNDLPAARAVIKRAAGEADVVVVQVHMGAEGSEKGHVRPGTEIFFGENRGDPMKFSRAVIDAGADAVVGHGPHVLRGMEFYKGRLIAYSLGNFAGGGNTLNNGGVLKYGGVLHVSLRKDGSFAGGKFLSTYMNSAGLPTRDSRKEAGRARVRELSADDFGDTAATIGRDGSIAAPK